VTSKNTVDKVGQSNSGVPIAVSCVGIVKGGALAAHPLRIKTSEMSRDLFNGRALALPFLWSAPARTRL